MDRYKEINAWRLNKIVILLSLSNKNNKTIGKQQLRGVSENRCCWKVEKILENTYGRVYFLIKLQVAGQQLYWKWFASEVFFKDFCLSYKLFFSIFFKLRNNYFQRTSSVAASNHRSKQKNCMWVYIYSNKKVKDSALYHPKLFWLESVLHNL